MTVQTTNSKVVLEGNGATTSFPVPIKFLENSDLVVTIVDDQGQVSSLTEGTGNGNYSLTGEGEEAGGTLTYPMGSGTVLPDGWQIQVARIVELKQDLDLTNQSGFQLELLEQSFDKIVMMMQQVYDKDAFRTIIMNSLNTAFDAGGERISNIGSPSEALDAVRNVDLNNLEQRFLANSEVSFTYWNLTGNGSTDYDINGATTSEAGAYDVLLDRVRQRPEVDYTINIGSNPPQINFINPVNNPTDIYILARGYNSQVIGGSSGSWNNLTDKPSTFPPDAHSHDYSAVFALITHGHSANDLPDGNTSQKGIVQTTTSTDSPSTTLVATASAVKAVKDMIGQGNVQDGTLLEKGILQLENSIASTSITKAATPASVKVAYDRGTEGVNAADAAQSAANAAQSTANSAQSAASAAQSTANNKADSNHNHNNDYQPKYTITETTSTATPTGGSDGDMVYVYEV